MTSEAEPDRARLHIRGRLGGQGLPHIYRIAALWDGILDYWEIFAMRLRRLAKLTMIASAALVFAAGSDLAVAAPFEHAPATMESLSKDILSAAREASGSAQAQGLSAAAAKRMVEAAIFGVISKSGADYSTNLGALRMTKIASGDPVIVNAVLAALTQVERVGQSGCSACSPSFTTGVGSIAGGAGTPAYSRRGPT